LKSIRIFPLLEKGLRKEMGRGKCDPCFPNRERKRNKNKTQIRVGE
jgi:hypothetical protein